MYEVDKIQYLQIGVQGENDATDIEIDMSAWAEKYPDAQFHILFKPYNASEPSPMLTTYEDGVLTWTVGAGATAVTGVGYTEIRAQDAETGLVKKTKIIPTAVENSVSGVETDPPASYQEWVTNVLNAGTAAVNANTAAQAAKTAAETARDAAQAAAGDFQDLSASVTGLAAGTSPTVDVTHSEGGYYNLAFGIPKGDKGDQGDPAPADQVVPAVNSYLAQVITNPDSPPLDRNLSSNVSAAPADMVGDLKSAISEETRNLIFDTMSGKTIGSDGKVANNASYDVHIAPIVSGEKYTLSSGESSNGSLFACYSVFSTIPVAGSTASYDGRHIVTDRVITAPITGYIALRTDANYQYAQVEHGEKETIFIPYITATDFAVREKEQKTENNIDILFAPDGIVGNYNLMKGNELITGLYAAEDGEYKSNRTDFCCSKHKMGVAPGDTITVKQTKGDSIENLLVTFYYGEGDFISYEKYTSKKDGLAIYTAPEGCDTFALSASHEYGVAITPSDYDFQIFINYEWSTTDEKANNGTTIVTKRLVIDDFSQKQYNASSYISNADAEKRIHVTNPIFAVKGSRVYYSMQNNQQFAFRVFPFMPGNGQTELYGTDWTGGDGVYEIPCTGYIAMNLRYSTNDAIVPSNFSSFIMFTINGYIPWVEEIKTWTGKTGGGIYFGDKIDLEGYKFSAEKIANVKISTSVPQSCCIYGDEMFLMFASSRFAVYNLQNETLTSIYSMGTGVPSLHCNSACFGNKQSAEDGYPLLYVNSYMDEVGKGKCYVQKIVKSGDDYSTELVQSISISFTDQEIWTGKTINPSTEANGNFIVDAASNRLIAYTTQGFDRTRFFIFELPDISTATVTLTENDILDYFDVAYIANIQDSCIRNGIIYLTAGIDWGYYDKILRIYAISYKGRSIVSEIPLEQVEFLNYEPEGIDYYDGGLLMTQEDGIVYRFTF